MHLAATSLQSQGHQPGAAGHKVDPLDPLMCSFRSPRRPVGS